MSTEKIDLPTAIRQVRKRYIDEGFSESYFAINNGQCSEIASDVAELLGGESDVLYSVENGNFMLGGDYESDKWDWPLLKKHWEICPPVGLKASDVNRIDFGLHIWLTVDKRHYDAECPDGVGNFFDLPLFRRCIVQCLREQGHQAEDVKTDDVVPAPLCPVPNPTSPQRAASACA